MPKSLKKKEKKYETFCLLFGCKIFLSNSPSEVFCFIFYLYKSLFFAYFFQICKNLPPEKINVFGYGILLRIFVSTGPLLIMKSNVCGRMSTKQNFKTKVTYLHIYSSFARFFPRKMHLSWEYFPGFLLYDLVYKEK